MAAVWRINRATRSIVSPSFVAWSFALTPVACVDIIEVADGPHRRRHAHVSINRIATPIDRKSDLHCASPWMEPW